MYRQACRVSMREIMPRNLTVLDEMLYPPFVSCNSLAWVYVLTCGMRTLTSLGCLKCHVPHVVPCMLASFTCLPLVLMGISRDSHLPTRDDIFGSNGNNMQLAETQKMFSVLMACTYCRRSVMSREACPGKRGFLEDGTDSIMITSEYPPTF